MDQFEAQLQELLRRIEEDRHSAACRRALIGLKSDRNLSERNLVEAFWETTLEALLRFFIDYPRGQDLHRNLLVADDALRQLLASCPAGKCGDEAWLKIRPYVDWLTRNSDVALLSHLWKVHEERHGYFRSFWFRWNRELVESGRLPRDFGPEEFLVALELKAEGDRVYSWPDARWTGWEWPRDISQYRALLDSASLMVRSGAGFVIGRYYLGAARMRMPCPPLQEMLAFVKTEERRSAGVAGAFLSGAMFGIEDLWRQEPPFDLREWMLETLAQGPEPEFTGFQSLSFHAHEYLEPTEVNLRRLIAMGRDDAALMLATEEFNHDPEAEASFQKRFQAWRREK